MTAIDTELDAPGEPRADGRDRRLTLLRRVAVTSGSLRS